MAIFLIPFQALCFILLFTLIKAQTNNNITDFSCPSSNSSESCRTYVVYRAQPPEFMDLGHISDLFGVSRSLIQTSSNLVSEEIMLLNDQLLLIPISCGCTHNNFSANISYHIKKDESFYLVSIHTFENLTDYQAVEAMNPTLNPTDLQIDVEVVIPLYCKCPTKADVEKGIKFFITYAWQERDSVSQLIRMLNTSMVDFVPENNYRNFTAAVRRPVLIPVSELPILYQPSYTLPRRKKFASLIIIISGVGALSVLALLFLLVFAYCKCYRTMASNLTGSRLEYFNIRRLKKESKDDNLSPRTQGKLLPGVSGYLGKPKVYETKTIMEATMNLNESYRIGCSVFRANINGECFAVKQRKGDITEELRILQKVNHANLVKLSGVTTVTDGTCFLVYEFAENGSLDKWLYPKSSSCSSSVTFLSWRKRLTIALDVANGLQYMHQHTRPSIVHRNIRTGNILLNSQFKAKIANFSMARPATETLTPKVDVYSFGIVLLELLSGRKSMETRDGGEIVMLWKDIRMVLECEEKQRVERLRNWMDPNLEGFYPVEGALSLAVIASACTLEKSSERPSIAEIAYGLSVHVESSREPFERSWASGVAEESMEIIKPVVAR
ncbi:serine/threonine receptor-like kinase NFP [Tasmannia lanceolata]|uniref:serine/threonine receptor-like kinase NFP n=1 Tax=Tasmannia lanceolata TaxID=3420 RepID=UPI00406304C1